MDISKVIIDHDLESEGVWFDYDATTRVKVARSNNKKHTAVQRRVFKPYRRQIKANTIDPDLFTRLLAESLAEGCIRDWEGIQNNGKKVDYSPGMSVKLLIDPNLRDFKDFVAECAEDGEAYRAEEIEEMAGNSQDG